MPQREGADRGEKEKSKARLRAGSLGYHQIPMVKRTASIEEVLAAVEAARDKVMADEVEVAHHAGHSQGDGVPDDRQRFHQKVGNQEEAEPDPVRGQCNFLGRNRLRPASAGESGRPARPSPSHPLSRYPPSLVSTPRSWLSVPAVSESHSPPRPRAAPRPWVRVSYTGGYEVQEKLNLEGAPGTVPSARSTSNTSSWCAVSCQSASPLQVTEEWTPRAAALATLFATALERQFRSRPMKPVVLIPAAKATLISHTRPDSRRIRAVCSLLARTTTCSS